jgi:hypothetical protein
MLNRDAPPGSAAGHPPDHPLSPRPSAATLLAAVIAAGPAMRDPRAARERFEEELRAALQARSVIVREDPVPFVSAPPNAVCIDVPQRPRRAERADRSGLRCAEAAGRPGGATAGGGLVPGSAPAAAGTGQWPIDCRPAPRRWRRPAHRIE